MRPVLLIALAVVLAGCSAQEGAVRDPTQQATTTPTAPSTVVPTPPPAQEKPPLPPQPGESVRQLNVTIRNAEFWPADVTVDPGSTVTWTNEDEAQHKIALDADANRTAGPVGEGQPAALTFHAAGTFPYHCEIHPEMKGVVRAQIVEPPPPPPAPAGNFSMNISGRTYSEGVLRVGLGSAITWTNLDFEPHEVEADAGGLFASPILLQGDSFTTTATRAGTFTYRCDFHGMKGTLIVE